MSSLHNKPKATRKRVRRVTQSSSKPSLPIGLCSPLSPESLSVSTESSLSKPAALFTELPSVPNFVFNGSHAYSSGTPVRLPLSAPASSMVSPQKEPVGLQAASLIFSPPKSLGSLAQNASMLQGWQFNMSSNNYLFSSGTVPTSTFSQPVSPNFCVPLYQPALSSTTTATPPTVAHSPPEILSPSSLANIPVFPAPVVDFSGGFSSGAAPVATPYFVPLTGNMPSSTSMSAGTSPLSSGVHSPNKKHARRYATRGSKKLFSSTVRHSNVELLNPVAAAAAELGAATAKFKDLSIDESDITTATRLRKAKDILTKSSVSLPTAMVFTSGNSAGQVLESSKPLSVNLNSTSNDSTVASVCDSCSCPQCIERRRNTDWLTRLTYLKRGLADLAECLYSTVASHSLDTENGTSAESFKNYDAILARLRLEADYLTTEDPGQLYNGLEELGQHWLQKVRARVTSYLADFGISTREAARVFAQRLRAEYTSLKYAARLQARVLITLEREHLSAMGLSWELLCAHWFHTVVFLCPEVSDRAGDLLDKLRPRIQDMEVPSAMSLYMELDSEMSRVSQEWRCAQAVLEGWQDQLAVAAAEAATLLPEDNSYPVSLESAMHPGSLSSTDDSFSRGSNSPLTANANGHGLSMSIKDNWESPEESGSIDSGSSPSSGTTIETESCVSKTIKDSKYCDCCYCEVFGHGGGQQPTIPARYLELREQLRQRLQRKKAGVVGSANERACRASLLDEAASEAVTSSSTNCASVFTTTTSTATMAVSRTTRSMKSCCSPPALPLATEFDDDTNVQDQVPSNIDDLDALLAYINGPDDEEEAKRRNVKRDKRARQKARKQKQQQQHQDAKVELPIADRNECQQQKRQTMSSLGQSSASLSMKEPLHENAPVSSEKQVIAVEKPPAQVAKNQPVESSIANVNVKLDQTAAIRKSSLKSSKPSKNISVIDNAQKQEFSVIPLPTSTASNHRKPPQPQQQPQRQVKPVPPPSSLLSPPVSTTNKASDLRLSGKPNSNHAQQSPLLKRNTNNANSTNNTMLSPSRNKTSSNSSVVETRTNGHVSIFSESPSSTETPKLRNENGGTNYRMNAPVPLTMADAVANCTTVSHVAKRNKRKPPKSSGITVATTSSSTTTTTVAGVNGTATNFAACPSQSQTGAALVRDDHLDPVVEEFLRFVEANPADRVNRVKIPLKVFENLKVLQKKK